MTDKVLPTIRNLLIRGRTEMKRISDESADVYVDPDSSRPSDLHLYTGALHSLFDRYAVLQRIQESTSYIIHRTVHSSSK